MAKRILILLDLLVITVAAYTLVNSFYLFVRSAATPPPQLKAAVRPENETARAGVVGPYDAYRMVADLDPFATAKPRPAASQSQATGSPDSLPATALNLKLLGTLTGSGDRSRAIIEDGQSQKQGLYKKDDTVQGGVIKAIKRNMVIVSVNGEDQILLLEDEQKKRQAAKGPGAAGGGNTIRLARADVEQSMRNIGLLMTQARWQPSFDPSGQPEGIAVNRIRPGSLVAKMGIGNGDVIQSVNGKDIRSMDDIMSAYGQFRSAESVQIQVKRGDNKETLSYSFE